MTAAVTTRILPSNSHKFVIEPVGATEQTKASTATNQPLIALQRRPAFHALPKTYRYGRNPVITINDTRLSYAALIVSPI